MRSVAPNGQVIEFPVRLASVRGDEAVAMGERLRRGEQIDDEEFDRIYDSRWRVPSYLHWSSTTVVRRVVELLSLTAEASVLDVGSGVGKFCLVGSLISGARFVGIERRASLVRVARRTGRALRATRAEFRCADGLACDWNGYDCIYLFNPFEEHLAAGSSRIDRSTYFSEDAYVPCVLEARRKLEALRPGTHVALYWGYGGELSKSFRLLHRERHGFGDLEVWRKEPAPKP